jgi:hypothetical protein
MKNCKTRLPGTDQPEVKKSIIISLFLPLFYTQLGYYGQFLWLQWRIKEAARESRLAALPDAAFVRIDQAAVDAAGKWEERGKECRFKDHLYDVIRSRTIGDTTWLFCLDDENEERLDRQSEQVIRTNQEQPDKKTGHALCLYIGDLICERQQWAIVAPGRLPRQYRSFDSLPLPGRYPEVAGPPPKG